jgi:hypothetical protein
MNRLTTVTSVTGGDLTELEVLGQTLGVVAVAVRAALAVEAPPVVVVLSPEGSALRTAQQVNTHLLPPLATPPRPV